MRWHGAQWHVVAMSPEPGLEHNIHGVLSVAAGAFFLAAGCCLSACAAVGRELCNLRLPHPIITVLQKQWTQERRCRAG